MSEPIHTFTGEIWEGIKWLFGALLLLIGWNAKRQIKRVDNIEASYVSEHEYNETIKALREELQRGFKETHSRIDQLLLRDRK